MTIYTNRTFSLAVGLNQHLCLSAFPSQPILPSSLPPMDVARATHITPLSRYHRIHTCSHVVCMYVAGYGEHLLREGRRAAYIDFTENASLGLTSAAGGAARPRDGGDALLVGHLASEEGRDGARIRSTKINITKLDLNTVSDRVVLCCPRATSTTPAAPHPLFQFPIPTRLFTLAVWLRTSFRSARCLLLLLPLLAAGAAPRAAASAVSSAASDTACLLALS